MALASRVSARTGEAAGLHFTALSRIERGESDPRLHVIASLGEALEADMPERLAGV